MSVEPAWGEYYGDEMDAAWLYRALARVESNPSRRAIFENLAQVEDEHVERWRALFHEHGGEVPPHSPSVRSRLLAAVARLFGSGSVLPLIIAEEAREVGSYLRLARGATDKTTHDTAVAIATESAEHAQHLSSSIGREGEPWHGQAAGGYLRSVVLRIQRWPDGELRSRRGRHRRQCRAASRHRDRDCRRARRRAVDGLERLSRGEERSGGRRTPGRHRTRRAAADARPRGEGAGADSRGERADGPTTHANRRKR